MSRRGLPYLPTYSDRMVTPNGAGDDEHQDRARLIPRCDALCAPCSAGVHTRCWKPDECACDVRLAGMQLLWLARVELERRVRSLEAERLRPSRLG